VQLIVTVLAVVARPARQLAPQLADAAAVVVFIQRFADFAQISWTSSWSSV
jgi:hypothetical protein